MQSLSNLNPEQKQAVTHTSGPLLIVAGAGTGKTTVITRRLAWLIEQKLAKSNEILALTFTDKASEEMEERLDKLLPYGYVDLWVSTFHSFCEKILKAHGLDIGLSTDFKLLSQTDAWLLIRQNLEKFNLDYYRPLGNPTKFIQALITHFSRLKDEEIWPGEYLEYAEKLRLNAGARVDEGGVKVRSKMLDVRGKMSKKDTSNIQHPTSNSNEIARIEEVANAYHVYQQLLHENNYLDFGDLINYTLKLFRTRKNLLAQFQKQFKYILVDEFQDTNWAQYELVKLLAGNKRNVAVVGDDDQCLPPDTNIETKEGRKKIKDIKQGDLVTTAVGKGYLSYKNVTRIFKNKKKTNFITFITKRGFKIKVTDNHKMFCFIPPRGDSKYFYVYLMHRQGLGWRMGITNDLTVRLRLERSADKIIAIKSCDSEREARYYETLYSLKYNIPTVCFKDRKGVVIKNEWLQRLYKDIDTEENVKKLAADLNIDLNSHHFCLDTVNRGNKLRVKINLELCSRNYRSKYSKNGYLINPQVLHKLSLETSDGSIVKRLKRAGYHLSEGRENGFRLRISNVDIGKLGQESLRIQKITNGIIEQSFKLGKVSFQTLKALMMPAKNVMVGQYLPVVTNKAVFYDRVTKKELSESRKPTTVYDLEIEKTHNFIANGFVVHNSIYKFRGASLSNILQFEKDFPKCEKVVLTKNYRSSQNILDLSYKFIQQNNPNRLEVALSKKSPTTNEGEQTFARLQEGEGISKKLQSQTKGAAEIKLLHTKTSDDEVQSVIKKILELKSSDKGVSNPPAPEGGQALARLQGESQTTWSDFAILIRANSMADAFCRGLARAKIPYQFLASKGLYTKSIILDILAYFKLLDNYHEGAALYRLLNSPMFKISPRDQSSLTYYCYKTADSLFEALQKISAISGISEDSVKKVQSLLSFIEKHSSLAKEKNTAELYVNIIKDIGLEEFLIKKDDQASHEDLNHLNQFYTRIRKFEDGNIDPKLRYFMQEINLEIESGEQGKLQFDADVGPDMVKIMTIHGAKGLEFKYVFIANLVDKRFPTINRQDPIQVPDELVKEILPQGDIHLEEERRLFYVAMTRAKQGLFFTQADDYGGTRAKKPSRFLFELGMEDKKLEMREMLESRDVKKNKIAQSQAFKHPALSNVEGSSIQASSPKHLPSHFSFSQLSSFQKCPLQYKYSYILRIPIHGKANFSFGTTMHSTLQKFFAQSLNQTGGQSSLFSESSSDTKIKLPSLSELLKFYEESWIDDWYESKSSKKDYKEKGKKILKDFYELIKDNPPQVQGLEKSFNLRLGDYSIRGRIDRFDKIDDGIELIDYKTGAIKEKLNPEDKEQLLVYQIAAEEVLGQKPTKLTYWYLDSNQPVSFLGTDEDKEKLKSDLLSRINQIKNSDFPPTPGWPCKFCDYREICEYRAD